MSWTASSSCLSSRSSVAVPPSPMIRIASSTRRIVSAVSGTRNRSVRVSDSLECHGNITTEHSRTESFLSLGSSAGRNVRFFKQPSAVEAATARLRVLYKHADLTRRDVEPIARLDTEPIELIAAKLRVDQAAMGTGKFEAHHR